MSGNVCTLIVTSSATLQPHHQALFNIADYLTGKYFVLKRGNGTHHFEVYSRATKIFRPTAAPAQHLPQV